MNYFFLFNWNKPFPYNKRIIRCLISICYFTTVKWSIFQWSGSVRRTKAQITIFLQYIHLNLNISRIFMLISKICFFTHTNKNIFNFRTTNLRNSIFVMHTPLFSPLSSSFRILRMQLPIQTSYKNRNWSYL